MDVLLHLNSAHTRRKVSYCRTYCKIWCDTAAPRSLRVWPYILLTVGDVLNEIPRRRNGSSTTLFRAKSGLFGLWLIRVVLTPHLLRACSVRELHMTSLITF